MKELEEKIVKVLVADREHFEEKYREFRGKYLREKAEVNRLRKLLKCTCGGKNEVDNLAFLDCEVCNPGVDQ